MKIENCNIPDIKLVINNIFNASNFAQRIDTKLNLDSNYTKLTCDINTTEIVLENNSNYTQYINNSEDSDIYTKVYYKNRNLDISLGKHKGENRRRRKISKFDNFP